MEIQYRKTFSRNVRRLRTKLALTQEELAERADMHWTYVSGVERCKYNVSLNTIVRLAKALGCQPHELLK
ncbi:MAG TPA: helix-turn-helix transcriptional regulator [Verrucomicrobiae bacterium]|nr:helix-turn-helix transcriptional regulator [Verrucomicrobiae bacterium]